MIMNTNPSKFPLKDLLTVLGTLVFGFFYFLSLNFITLGDTQSSIIGAIIVSCILGGLAFGAKMLKSTSRNFQTCRIGEWAMLFLFIVIAFFSLKPFSHYFAISAEKEEIQQIVLSNITQASGLYDDYESYADMRIDNYRNRLESAVKAHQKNVSDVAYRALGFVSGTNDNNQMENKMLSLQIELYPSNYSQKKQVDSVWLSNAEEQVKEWSPTGIVKIVNTLKAEIETWNEQLKSYSSYRADGENEGIATFNRRTNIDDVSNKFTKSTNPTPFGVIIAMLLYLLMMLSYLISKRHTKNPLTLLGQRKTMKDAGVDIPERIYR